MKTKKSKRFLNLATLCLALLGTTLLMGRPVKAEGSVVSDNSSGSTSSLVDDSEREVKEIRLVDNMKQEI
ncbi:TPA: hypothetical protein VIE79_000661 [Streptococcus pyogenes]|nr:hypothetical protein [Streptococcus pyogenes]